MKNIKDAGAVVTIKCAGDVRELGMNIKKAREELEHYCNDIVEGRTELSRFRIRTRHDQIPHKDCIRIFSHKNYFLDLKRDYFEWVCEILGERIADIAENDSYFAKLIKRKGYKDLIKQMAIDEYVISSKMLKYCLDDILPIVAEPELLNQEVKRWADTHLCEEDYLVERLRRYLDSKKNLDELIAQRLEEGLKWWALK